MGRFVVMSKRLMSTNSQTFSKVLQGRPAKASALLTAECGAWQAKLDNDLMQPEKAP